MTPSKSFLRFLKITVGIAVIVFAAGSIRLLWASLSDEHRYRKDYLQDYLAARAFSADENPYENLPQLKSRFLPGEGNTVNIFPHPTPHPPPAILFASFFASFDYALSTKVWLLFELAMLYVAIFILLRELGFKLGVVSVAVAVTFAIGARPIQLELVVGQYELLLLALAVVFGKAYIEGRDTLAALALSLCLLIKFFAWPLFLFALAARRYRLALKTIAFFFLGYLICLSLFGLPSLVSYFQETPEIIERYYRTDPQNISLWTSGERLFAGMKAPAEGGLSIAPLLNDPGSARGVSIAIVLLSLSLVIFAALSMTSTWMALAALFAFSAIVTPVAWTHALSICLIGVAALFKAWLRTPPSPRLRQAIVAVATLLYLGDFFQVLLLDGETTLGFSAGLLTSIPTIAVLSFILLLYRADKSTKL